MDQIMQKANNRVIIIKIWRNDHEVKAYRSRKTRRIIAKIKADIFVKASLKVWYGKYLSQSGKIENFTNEGIYCNQKDLLYALSAFLET